MDQHGVISSMGQLVSYASQLHQGVGHENLWWRGQAEDLPLVPRVFRNNRTGSYEANVAQDFRRRAPARHSSVPPYDAKTRWLFLMQHYRLPTRLLDWADAPLVALHFAVTAAKGSDGVLWCLNPALLNDSLHDEPYNICQVGSEPVITLVDFAFDPYADSDVRVAALEPQVEDLRVLVQQSKFTLHGSPVPLEQRGKSQRFLWKFTVPAGAKNRLEAELRMCGINQAALFPDLERLAGELRDIGFRDSHLGPTSDHIGM